jgi:hypothetical protein
MRLPFMNLTIMEEPIEIVKEIYSFENLLACVVLKFQDYIFVIFKGSTQRSEYVLDTMLNFVPVNDYKVHYGFYNYYQIIKDDVINTVLSVDEPGFKIIASGMSLGACTSHLFSIDMASLTTNTISNIVIAPPKCGDSKFYNHLLSIPTIKVIGYENIRDVIPKLPPFRYGKLKSIKFDVQEGDIYKNHIVAYQNYFYNVKGCRISNQYI